MNDERGEEIFEQIAQRIRENPAGFATISVISAAAGMGRTAVNDLFLEHAHQSVENFVRRIRIQTVCRAIEHGVSIPAFADNSAFRHQFVTHTGLTVEAYAGLANACEFRLRLPTGYRNIEALAFYGRDPMSVGEKVSAAGITKALLIEQRPAIIEIAFDGRFSVIRTDAVNRFAAHRAAVRMLGIGSEAAAFERQSCDDPVLGKLIARQTGLRIPLTPEPWEALAWAIMGQQISVKAAVALRRELIAKVGSQHSSGLFAHPSAEAVASLSHEVFRGLKFSRSKAEYMLEAASAVSRGEPALESLEYVSVQCASRLLGKIRGVGPWTVQYTLLRGYGLADCVPAADAGLAQGVERVTGRRPDPTEIREMLSRFAPWRSFATYHIWASLRSTTGSKRGEVNDAV